MMALFALATAAVSETGLVKQDDEDASVRACVGSSPPMAWAAIPPGMGTTLTPVLFSGGRAALAHRRLPPRLGPAAASSARSLRTTRSATSSPTPTCSRVLPAAPGRQAGPFGRYRPADLQARDRYLLRSEEPSPVAEDRPHFYVQTLAAA